MPCLSLRVFLEDAPKVLQQERLRLFVVPAGFQPLRRPPRALGPIASGGFRDFHQLPPAVRCAIVETSGDIGIAFGEAWGDGGSPRRYPPSQPLEAQVPVAPKALDSLLWLPSSHLDDEAPVLKRGGHLPN